MTTARRTITAAVSALCLLTGVPAVADPASQAQLPTAGPALSAWARAAEKPRTAIKGVGDVSLDGNPDLLAVNATTSDLTVQLGTGAANGAGAFASGVKVGTFPVIRHWMGQGDINGDGRTDLVSVANDGVLYFAFHSGVFNGAQTFQPDLPFGSGWHAASLITITDFMGRDRENPFVLDGLADIIFRVNNTLYIYLNEGLNADGKPQFTLLGALFNDMQAVTSLNITDVTGDDGPDFYMTLDNGSAWLYDVFAEQDANGNWVGKWYTIQATGVEGAPVRLLTDVNGDDFADLIIRTPSGDLRAQLNAADWDPARPSRLFDVANEKLLATGWSQYRLIG
jgi:hypothetical protein